MTITLGPNELVNKLASGELYIDRLETRLANDNKITGNPLDTMRLVVCDAESSNGMVNQYTLKMTWRVFEALKRCVAEKKAA